MADPIAESSTETKPVAKAKRSTPRRRWALLVWLLMLALLAAAIAGGYLVWRQLQDLRQQQTQSASAVELERRAGALAQAADALGARLDALAQDTGGAQRGLNALQQQVAALSETQHGLAERVDVREQARGGEWLRAEAAYLAKVANYRLRFYQDVDGALAALRLADQALARQGSDTIKARQAINRAINQLVALDVADVDALATRLEALINTVDVLPLDLQIREANAKEEAKEDATGGTTDETAAEAPVRAWRAGLQRAWSRFKETLGELVVVRRDRQVEPLIAPEERYFLYHNLRLRLEASRLALIDRNEAVYQRSLGRAEEWILRYYAAGEPEVEQVLDEIRQLREVDVDPELPDIAALLQPVTRETLTYSGGRVGVQGTLLLGASRRAMVVPWPSGATTQQSALDPNPEGARTLLAPGFVAPFGRIDIRPAGRASPGTKSASSAVAGIGQSFPN